MNASCRVACRQVHVHILERPSKTDSLSPCSNDIQGPRYRPDIFHDFVLDILRQKRGKRVATGGRDRDVERGGGEGPGIGSVRCGWRLMRGFRGSFCCGCWVVEDGKFGGRVGG